MVQIVRKAAADPADLPEPLAQLAAQALATSLREPRPAGFPLLFTKHWQLIEPAVAFLHEHAIQRAHRRHAQEPTPRSSTTGSDTLEQNDIPGTRRMLSTWLPIATA